jgi:hypothetical protein
MANKLFRTAIVIQIDGTFDPSRMDEQQAADTAASKVVNDALAHIHTIENGLKVTNIINCGESI